jgi:hypothetical protein
VLSDGLPFVFVCDAYCLLVIPTADLDVALRAKYGELVAVGHFLSFLEAPFTATNDAVNAWKVWRKRVRVEHTLATTKITSAGFEDREDHRIPFASVVTLISD